MTAALPAQPKIYHILHVDRLASVIADGALFSDAQMTQRAGAGTTIGMNDIKALCCQGQDFVQIRLADSDSSAPGPLRSLL